MSIYNEASKLKSPWRLFGIDAYWFLGVWKGAKIDNHTNNVEKRVDEGGGRCEGR